MGVSGNPANRAAARAQGRGSVSRVMSQLVVIEELGDEPHTTIAAAVVNGLGALIEQGAAPLERCAITIGRDHPEHRGKVVLELKTDRRAPKGEPALELGAPLELPEVKP